MSCRFIGTSLNNIYLCKRRPTILFSEGNLICLAVVSRNFMANGNQVFSSLLRPTERYNHVTLHFKPDANMWNKLSSCLVSSLNMGCKRVLGLIICINVFLFMLCQSQ